MNLPQPKSIQGPLAEKLAHYVYLLVDPRDGVIFYVGKGVDDRCLQHGPNDDLGAKSTRLSELKAAGLEPRIEILRHGLETAAEALLIEAAAIDLLGLGNLTNIQPGHGASELGRATLAELSVRYMPEDAVVRHRVIMLLIAQNYKPGLSAEELYQVARGIWRVSPDRAHACQYVLAVMEGVVREAYVASSWELADSANFPLRKDLSPEDFGNRHQFTGTLAPDEIRAHYIGKSVRHLIPQGNQSPVLYGPGA